LKRHPCCVQLALATHPSFEAAASHATAVSTPVAEEIKNK